MQAVWNHEYLEQDEPWLKLETMDIYTQRAY